MYARWAAICVIGLLCAAVAAYTWSDISALRARHPPAPAPSQRSSPQAAQLPPPAPIAAAPASPPATPAPTIAAPPPSSGPQVAAAPAAPNPAAQAPPPPQLAAT